MVQTRAASKRIESGQALPQDTAVVPSPAKKRRRDGAESYKKRYRGKPGELCQLNLDVLFLIAAYIHPLDLLNLARTCRSLRMLLMDKSSAFVWKTARRQVKGLPDCPTDLTEPGYANLVFYARCHGCGKHAKKVLWTIRRRYCRDCRDQRLRYLSSCPDIIRQDCVLPRESLTIEGETTLTMCVDQEQMHSFLQEYDRSSDKEQFLNDKRDQYSAIDRHARNCRYWEKDVASGRRFDLRFRRQKRDHSIFERLKQHGYEPEIAYFGHYAIKQSRKSLFKTSKPLTDKEWARMWPEWLETMNNFRSQRLNRTVYQPRRDVLVSEYASYMASPSPDTYLFDLLPHVTDLIRFPPFRDIIYAPEGTQMGVKLFEPAFAKLPVLIDEWRKQLDVELAELVTIPSHFSCKGASSGQAVSSSNAAPMESAQTTTDKLHLACAVFDTGSNAIFTHPEVFSSSMCRRTMNRGEGDGERTVSFRDRFGIKILEDAPYIVHACGLDPNVATAEDMDRRNARLKCRSCTENPYIRSWRDALYHALYYHQTGKALLSTSSRWQIISDEYIDAIQAVELPVMKELPTRWMRCLLCHPSVGDAMLHHDTMGHLVDRHGTERDAIKQGVHYAPVGMDEPCTMMVMVEEEGQVAFTVPIYTISR